MLHLSEEKLPERDGVDDLGRLVVSLLACILAGIIVAWGIIG